MSSNNFDTRLQPNCRNFDRYGRRKRITKPYIIGGFSIDQNRQFIPDHSRCQYLKLPPIDQPIHFDLNEGYESVQHKPDSSDRLDHILKFILLNVKKLLATPMGPEHTDRFLNFDIICFRGKLRMLMCTPYSFRDAWSLLATKWKGNIYLCGHKTEQEKLKEANETEQSKKICSYGFKFEQFVMSESLTTEPDTGRPVLEGEEFCCMFTTKLEGTTILYGAEMDGIEGDTALSDDLNAFKFTEVKVRLQPSNQRQIDNFNRFKTINWWCQSYLTNVQKIVVGMRTENGIVNRLESIDVQSMPERNERFWSDIICMDFLDNFLYMVKHFLKNVDCPHTVYKFDYDSSISSSIQCTALNGLNDCTFLPDWYINEVQKFHSK